MICIGINILHSKQQEVSSEINGVHKHVLSRFQEEILKKEILYDIICLSIFLPVDCISAQPEFESFCNRLSNNYVEEKKRSLLRLR